MLPRAEIFKRCACIPDFIVIFALRRQTGIFTLKAEKDMRSDSVVIIPTYNEKENIENIIRAVLGLEQPFDMLIIDDGSPDGTAAIVKRLMADEFKDRLHLIERSGKLGLGTAYITGFKWAVEQKYDYIFEMDPGIPVLLPCPSLCPTTPSCNRSPG